MNTKFIAKAGSPNKKMDRDELITLAHNLGLQDSYIDNLTTDELHRVVLFLEFNADKED